MSNPKVLVVDDVTSARRSTVRFLQELGFKSIDEAKNGFEALEKLKGERYALVISDWDMPDMFGVDLLKEVRASATMKDLPFIMLTSSASKETVISALQAGVSEYIVKPLTVQILSDKLKKFPEIRP